MFKYTRRKKRNPINEFIKNKSLRANARASSEENNTKNKEELNGLVVVVDADVCVVFVDGTE